MDTEPILEKIHAIYAKGMIFDLPYVKLKNISYIDFRIQIMDVICEIERENPLRIAAYISIRVLKGFVRYRTGTCEVEAGLGMPPRDALYYRHLFHKLKYFNVSYLWVKNSLGAVAVRML